MKVVQKMVKDVVIFYLLIVIKCGQCLELSLFANLKLNMRSIFTKYFAFDAQVTVKSSDRQLLEL